jgi:peptidyl-prolyl cis-trans isomerase D
MVKNFDKPKQILYFCTLQKNVNNMSVIQKIRNKYIGFVVGAIVVALIGFLVMDAMQSNVRSIFSGDQTLLADINGKRIDYKNFEVLRQKYEENMKQRSKDGNLTDEERSQLMDQTWSDIVNETLINEELEKLGLGFTEKELQDMLTGPFADPMVQQNFADPNTGIFDPNRVSQFLSQMGQDKTGQQRAQWKEFEEAMIKNRKMTKYTDMVTKGIYLPKFMMEDMSKQQTGVSAISFVQLPYTMINDADVKVSDDEIKKYMEKNKELFTTQEATAKAEYVVFDIIPSKEDTAESLGSLLTVRDAFVAATENEEFLSQNNSEETLRDVYYTEKTLEAINPAEVLASAVGAVTGPFYMNGSYKMMKVVDKKSMPDSVKASHILIAITEQRTEAQAKASIDSIEAMVNSGADFAQLAATRSDDQNSGKMGGDLGYFTQEAMEGQLSEIVKESFAGKVGDKKVVKTQYGYHLINITDQKNFQTAVKVAVMSKTLQAGQATTNAAFAKANEFAASAKDAASFTETAKKLGKDKRVADNITKTQQIIPGIGSARELTRWVFDAKIGSVSQIFNLDDKCIIAVASNRQDKGTMANIETVRTQVEGILKRDKKGQMLIEKAKGKTSLQDLALLGNTTVKNADTVIYVGGGNNEIGFEPKVIGAAFNKSLVNKVSPGIPGEQGVYFITVKNIQPGTSMFNDKDPMFNMQRRSMERQMTQQAQNIIPYVLKKAAKIEDNRSNFY